MAIPKNYITLVNDAIKESKVTLDPLTAETFDNPPRTRLYSLFKDWINDAYVELFLSPNEWEFKSARITVMVEPAILLQNVASPVEIGDVLVGQSSDVIFTVTGVSFHEEAPLTLPDEVTVYGIFNTDYNLPYHFQQGEVILREDAPVATYGGIGSHDFAEQITGMDELFHTNIRMFDVPESDEHYSHGYTAGNLVRYLPWNQHNYYPTTSVWGAFISKNPQGHYQFFPPLQKPMLLSFDYSQHPTPMVNATDYPEFLPAKYHDYLVWKAVMEYADFDNKADVFRRAKKHIDRHEFTMYKEELPEVSIAWLS